MKLNNKSSVFFWLDYVAVAIIVIAFFVISYFGFYLGDDLSMACGRIPTKSGMRVGEISSIIDVFKLTWWWYFHLGGRFFSVAAQYYFCGLLGNRIWFDIVNTLFFMVLMIICGRLVNNGNSNGVRCVLFFALLFWFLCPVPNETLFWVAGSTTHLWGNTLALFFLALFFKYNNENFSVGAKIGLFIMSVFAAAEFIPCVSICGAIVVYYAFHLKRFKGNAVPLVLGFFVGSFFVLFAPGNFVRASEDLNMSFFDSMKALLSYPVQEIVKFRAFWLFLFIFVWGWIKDKELAKIWVKKNSILLLSLGWSIFAFSVVFRPANRALFFPETISLILFVRFLFENNQIFEIRVFNKSKHNNLYVARSALLVLLFVVFMVDSVFAVTETKKQSKNNDVQLEEIVDSGGIVALDQMISSHRMAYVANFPTWTWEPLADRFGLDSVHIYPFFCQDKYYKLTPPMDNIYIDEINYDNDNDVFGKYIRLIVRLKTKELQASNNHVTITIDYTRPKKWYKIWLDKLRNYQYDRTEIVERDNPNVCFNGYCYYVIWFGRENAKNLKSIKYEIE